MLIPQVRPGGAAPVPHLSPAWVCLGLESGWVQSQPHPLENHSNPRGRGSWVPTITAPPWEMRKWGGVVGVPRWKEQPGPSHLSSDQQPVSLSTQVCTPVPGGHLPRPVPSAGCPRTGTGQRRAGPPSNRPLLGKDLRWHTSHFFFLNLVRNAIHFSTFQKLVEKNNTRSENWIKLRKL